LDTSQITNERCTRCGLPCAAWRVVRGDRVYCTAFCATRDDRADVGALAPSGTEWWGVRPLSAVLAFWCEPCSGRRDANYEVPVEELPWSGGGSGPVAGAAGGGAPQSWLASGMKMRELLSPMFRTSHPPGTDALSTETPASPLACLS
jgi:hypothetical protein